VKDLSARLLFGCFLRSYLVKAAYNPLGLQNIGFMYAVEPALAALYDPGPRLAAARMRYASHYNCHPFFTPMLLGVFLRMETAIAEGRLDAAILEGLKDTTANTLSAIGDSFFNGSLLALWALSASCLVLGGLPGAAVSLTVCAFLLLQVFRLSSFILGIKNGMSVLLFLRRLDLINRGDKLKGVNAVLLALLLWLALPGAGPAAWTGALLCLLLAGWAADRMHVPRIFLALVLLAFGVAMHTYDMFDQSPALFLP
jgi:PTS system mannose-specific IID component